MLEYMMWILWYGFMAILIAVALVISCCIIAAMIYGMCCLMERFNKKGYHG